MHIATLFASLILIAVCVACDATRDRLMQDKFPSYPETIKRAIHRGFLVNGMDYDQVFLTLGEPICTKTIQHNGRPVEVWLYPPGGKNPCVTAELRVYFENGVVSGWQRVHLEAGG